MADCSIRMPAGNVNCLVPFVEVKRCIITDKDVSFSSLSDLLNLATWKTKIYTDLDVWIPRNIDSYENTTDDPNIITSESNTKKYITNNPAPSGSFWLDANFCDYKNLQEELRGGTFGIIYELKDGSFLLKQNDAGTFSPLLANLHAFNKGLPMQADINKNWLVHIFHHDYGDFRKAAVIKPAWDSNDLILSMPAGVNMRATGVYDTAGDGDITVYITERCGDPIESLAVANFEVLGSNNLTSPAITAVSDDSDGNYTITLQKEVTPEDLVAGDYITWRVNTTAASITSQLSNAITTVAP